MNPAKDTAPGTSTSGDFPESWRGFNADGDLFVGTVDGYSEGPGKFGPVPILQASDTEGKAWSIWLFSSILREKVGKAAPKPGEKIVVTYLGEATSQASGNTYKRWAVEMPERDATLPDFSEWALQNPDEGKPDWGEGS